MILQRALLMLVCLAGPQISFAAPAVAYDVKARDLLTQLIEISKLSKQKVEAKSHEAQILIEKVSAQIDYSGLSSRSLGPRWAKLKPAERSEFISILQGLLEKVAYPQAQKIAVDPAQIKFVPVAGKAGYLKATGEVEREKKGERVVSQVDLTLIFDRKNQKLVDAIVEGEQISKNLKRQFDESLKKKSFQQMLDQMKRRLDKAEAEKK
jgi:ABC-type transporter MlaC component